MLRSKMWFLRCESAKHEGNSLGLVTQLYRSRKLIQHTGHNTWQSEVHNCLIIARFLCLTYAWIYDLVCLYKITYLVFDCCLFAAAVTAVPAKLRALALRRNNRRHSQFRSAPVSILFARRLYIYIIKLHFYSAITLGIARSEVLCTW